MKAATRTVAGHLALLALLGCSGTGEKAEGAWGKAEEGLRAMLLAPRGAVSLGEHIVLHVRVRNQTGEVAPLASAHSLTLRVTRGDKTMGNDLDYVNLASEAVLLAPGEERSFPLREYATDGPDAKLCKGPGLYRFQGQLGKLELPPVEVRVE